jgi:hypothetical protein
MLRFASAVAVASAATHDPAGAGYAAIKAPHMPGKIEGLYERITTHSKGFAIIAKSEGDCKKAEGVLRGFESNCWVFNDWGSLNLATASGGKVSGDYVIYGIQHDSKHRCPPASHTKYGMHAPCKAAIVTSNFEDYKPDDWAQYQTGYMEWRGIRYPFNEFSKHTAQNLIKADMEAYYEDKLHNPAVRVRLPSDWEV